ncbi:SnoaL-like protein [Prauserella shujinwangii]|uniref:SnoaL-like protein n=1 Tax=Prauserella shujinwangii TaxID=1453103 RepID=A0A2T0LSQ8_9PSEU|nr:nuclear transport factor 2 family protein [Prauserella shujinwangii]PRX46662.1 SnoaL-like protein [Prauserella shujinwangii]
MDTPVPGVVRTFFEASSRRDVEAITGLFTEDGVVVDEAATRRGTGEIRAWQEGPASQYRYTTEVLATEVQGEDVFLVRGRIVGDFPGGTADLTWRFTLAGERIHRLEIAP